MLYSVERTFWIDENWMTLTLFLEETTCKLNKTWNIAKKEFKKKAVATVSIELDRVANKIWGRSQQGYNNIHILILKDHLNL
jgi:hypothetical protein